MILAQPQKCFFLTVSLYMSLWKRRKMPLRAAGGYPDSHDLSNPSTGHQVSDIPEGQSDYQLSGMSAL